MQRANRDEGLSGAEQGPSDGLYDIPAEWAERASSEEPVAVAGTVECVARAPCDSHGRSDRW